MDRSLTNYPIAHKSRIDLFCARQFGATVMIPRESPAKSPTTEAAARKQNDRFLYQRRVSEKISARVVGNRNGGPNSFHRGLESAVFPGQRVSSRWHNQRGVPVL